MRLALRALLVVAIALPACRKVQRAPRFAIEIAGTRVLVDEAFGSDSRFPIDSLAHSGAGNLDGWETLELNYAADGD